MEQVSPDRLGVLLEDPLYRGLEESGPLEISGVFIDFLGLPQKHSEKKLRMGLVEYMKQFILELGKDFKRQLIPKEKMQILLREYCDMALL